MLSPACKCPAVMNATQGGHMPMLSHTCMLPACGMRPCTTYLLQLDYRSHTCIVIFYLHIDFTQSPARKLHARKNSRRQTFDWPCPRHVGFMIPHPVAKYFEMIAGWLCPDQMTKRDLYSYHLTDYDMLHLIPSAVTKSASGV